MSAATIVVLLGSSVGCVSLKHYVRRHTLVADITEKHASNYYHCPHCGQIIPREGFYKCPRCMQVPVYHGYEPTCWRQFPSGWGCPPESVTNNPEFWSHGMLDSSQIQGGHPGTVEMLPEAGEMIPPANGQASPVNPPAPISDEDTNIRSMNDVNQVPPPPQPNKPAEPIETPIDGEVQRSVPRADVAKQPAEVPAPAAATNRTVGPVVARLSDAAKPAAPQQQRPQSAQPQVVAATGPAPQPAIAPQPVVAPQPVPAPQPVVASQNANPFGPASVLAKPTTTVAPAPAWMETSPLKVADAPSPVQPPAPVSVPAEPKPMVAVQSSPANGSRSVLESNAAGQSKSVLRESTAPSSTETTAPLAATTAPELVRLPTAVIPVRKLAPLTAVPMEQAVPREQPVTVTEPQPEVISLPQPSIVVAENQPVAVAEQPAVVKQPVSVAPIAQQQLDAEALRRIAPSDERGPIPVRQVKLSIDSDSNFERAAGDYPPKVNRIAVPQGVPQVMPAHSTGNRHPMPVRRIPLSELPFRIQQ